MQPTLPPSGATEPNRRPGPAIPFPDRYEAIAEIGRGGMGIVYRAHDCKLDRLVALKVLLGEVTDDRFLREAKLLAKISSPHVVTVYDLDTMSDGSPLISMEWIDGRDLLHIMRLHGGTIDEAAALEWMKQVSEGMLAAANLGVIHRDLKPSNILIDHVGRARVADFGLACQSAAASNLTFSGQILGTPHYMSPEQAEDSRSVDTRSDVYSFGATFYHALTGATPFTGSNPLNVLNKHRTEPLISPKARCPAISHRTNEILERCMAKTPADRFSGFAEVLKYLAGDMRRDSPWDGADDRELVPYIESYTRIKEACLQRCLPPGESSCLCFPTGRKLRFVTGNIVDQRVDAIVSSDDSNLSMGGGVSYAIRCRAGKIIEQEAGRYIPVRPGRAVVTSAGALAARFVFHGVTLGDEASPPSRDLISEIMRSCFYHAETLNLKSIAFPLLGTGVGGFSPSVCLDTMFRCAARALLSGTTMLEEIQIVLFADMSR